MSQGPLQQPLLLDMHTPPQIFGGMNGENNMFTSSLGGQFHSEDDNYGFEDGFDHNDPKRRRIARVCDGRRIKGKSQSIDRLVGMRYVSQEKNSV